MSSRPKEEEEYEHPSFVAVKFSRISGRRRFFGSSVTSDTWIELTISKAKMIHGHGSDRVYGELGSLIKVQLSPAQFAELLTTMNVGSGVPGTMTRLGGKEIEQLRDEDIKSETKRIRDQFKKTVKEKLKEINADKLEIVDILQKQKLSKEDKKRIEWLIERVTRIGEDHAPFIMDQFDESAGKIVAQAKAEVDAFVTHAVQTTGLQALRNSAPQLVEEKEST